jgi:hypothetical protein
VVHATEPKITGNTIKNTENQAIGLVNNNGFGSGGPVVDAKVNRNLIEDSRIGVVISEVTSNGRSSSITDELKNNHFVDNVDNTLAVVGNVKNEGEIDASNNFFDTADLNNIDVLLQAGDVNVNPIAGVPIDPDAGDEGEE